MYYLAILPYQVTNTPCYSMGSIIERPQIRKFQILIATDAISLIYRNWSLDFQIGWTLNKFKLLGQFLSNHQAPISTCVLDLTSICSTGSHTVPQYLEFQILSVHSQFFIRSSLRLHGQTKPLDCFLVWQVLVAPTSDSFSRFYIKSLSCIKNTLRLRNANSYH